MLASVDALCDGVLMRMYAVFISGTIKVSDANISSCLINAEGPYISSSWNYKAWAQVLLF
jgi:hypothetical protein